MADVTSLLLEQYQELDDEGELEGAADPTQESREGTLLEQRDQWGMRPAVESAVPQSAAWTYLYHRVTGARHGPMPKNTAQEAMKRVFRAKDEVEPELIGKTVFTRTPVTEERLGQFRCWLYPGTETCKRCGQAHGASPGAKERIEQGFPACYSAHLANEFQQGSHMRRKHPSAYEAWERDRQDRERRETLALQQAQTEALLAVARGQASAPAAAVVAPVKRGLPVTGGVATCTVCGEVFKASIQMAANAKLKGHERKAHFSRPGDPGKE